MLGLGKGETGWVRAELTLYRRRTVVRDLLQVERVKSELRLPEWMDCKGDQEPG